MPLNMSILYDMNYLVSLILPLILSIAPDLKSDPELAGNSSNPESDIEWIKAVTQLYSPDSWALLMNYESLPDQVESTLLQGGLAYIRKSVSTFEYLEGKNRKELLYTMATNIHEIAHAYYRHNVFGYVNENAMQINWDRAEGYIYLSPSQHFFLSFPKESLFPARELTSEIGKELRTFRYNTYIRGNTSTQDEGVLGLLNEFHAYYLESKYFYEMLDAYKIAGGSDAQGLLDWVSQAQSIFSAFYEFDFFIKEYLLRMKHRYPDDYLVMLQDQSFREAFRAVSDSYEQLTVSYIDLILNEIAAINSSGKAFATIQNGYLWTGSSNSANRTGTPLFSEAKDVLNPVLLSDRYHDLIKDF